MSDKPKHAGGRPRKYKSPQQMQTEIDKYFNRCEEEKERITITGLAYDLGFNSRMGFYNYEGYGDEFLDTIKRALFRVEKAYEANLGNQACAGSIFALKNFKQNWSDKQEVTGKDGAALLAPVIHVQPPSEARDNTDTIQPDDDKGSIE